MNSSIEEYGYFLATVEPPSAVLHSVYAHFLSNTTHNLIVNKTSRLEVYEIASNGLVAKLQIPLNGRITALKTISSSDGDMLFICTEKEQFCLLKYDSSTSSVFTLTHGDLHDRACRPIEQGIIVASSPNVPYIVIHHVQGLVKVIPIDTRRGSLREPVNRRIEELQVLDIKLLDNGELAVLHETAGGGYRVKTYRVGKELENGWNIDDLDEGSHILIPIPSPRGGIIVISGVSIFYYNHANNAQCAVSLVPTRITCYCQIDENGYRFLLANSEGELFVLILFGEGDRVDSLKMEFLGTTVIPSTLTYLDNGFVYIGSHLGDSQIIHLSSPRLADGNFVKIMNVIQSTAPMVDFATVDLEMIGQSSVVACCGAYKEGSLRIIRKGANLTASAAVDIQMSILYMFTVARNEENIVFLSTLNETKILRCDDGGIEELTAYEQLYTNESSLLITECEGIVIQVTPSTVSFGGKLWKPKNGASIVTVGCYENMIALCTMDRQLYTLDCQRPPKSAGIALPGETSAVCIAFIEGCWFTIMAFWNSSKLHVINDEGVTVGSIAVKTRELIRSLQFSIFEEIPTLFVGLGDGSVLHFTVLLDGLELIAGPMHRAVLGSGPVRIVKTKIGMTETLFAFSDRPFIIDSFRERITFSLTNAKNVSAVTGVGDELLLARDGSLVFCTVDREGQLHHQVHSLGETATRILHVPNAKAYALLTSPLHSTESIIEDREKDVGRSHVELLDQDVLTKLDSYELGHGERASSITSMYLVAQNLDAVIVGTAIIRERGEEPQLGRILTFITSSDRKLQLLSQTPVPGCVYALSPIDGKIVVAINGMTSLYRWTHMEGDAFSWKHIDSHFGQILGIKMDVRGDLIAVGDLMKSITLLRIDTSGEKLSELARDSEPNWMTEVRFISDMQLLGADNLGNVFVMERRRDPHFAGEKWKLVGMAGFHIGEVVNRIARGTLTRQGEQSVISNPHLLATTCGSIYLFGMLPIRQYSILKVVERNLNIVNNPIGGLSHSTWRALATERRKPRPMESFLDGDLIAKFLDLPSEDMKKLIAEGGRGKYEVTGGNVAEVTELIESLLAAYQ